MSKAILKLSAARPQGIFSVLKFFFLYSLANPAACLHANTQRQARPQGIRLLSTFKIFLLFAAILLLNNTVYAKTASISNIDVFNAGKRLLLNASLKDGFSDDVTEAIKSGVPVGITYTVVLKQKIPFFYDKKVVTRTIKKYVKFDTLKEKYKLIANNGRKTTKRVTGDFNEVLRTMTQLDSINIISNKRLDRKENYYVSVKAKLNSKRAWFPFNYILLFTSYLNFDTSWNNSSPFSFK